MKKAFSKILALCMIVSCIPCGLKPLKPQTAHAAANIAYADFENNDETKNLTVTKSNNGITKTEVCGHKTYQLDRTKDRKTFGKINIDINDDFFCGNSDGTEFAVTVDYVDYGDGHFNIHYNGKNGESYTETVFAGSTGKIKSHTFTLTDAEFKNGLDGSDLAVTFPYSGSNRSVSVAYISAVRIEKRTAKNPVTAVLTGTEAGHIFNYAHTPEFENVLTNNSDEQKTVKISYSAKYHGGGVLWTGSDSVTLAPREVKTLTVKPNITKYGLYDLNAEFDSSDYTAETQFSYVNTSPDGAKNERMMFCTHAYAINGPESSLITVDILEKANAAGARGDLYWHQVEKKDGVYDYETSYGPIIEALKERGMKYLAVGAYGGKYGLKYYAVPNTEVQKTAYTNYLKETLKRYGTDTVLIEIWNEPNWISRDYATPEQFAAFTKEVAMSIKADYPSAKIGALALCGIGTSAESTHKTSAYTEAAINEGVFDYADAETFHPYCSLKSPDKSDMIDRTLYLMNKVWDAKTEYADKKIWITEAGWSTARKAYPEFTRQEQASYHPKYFIEWDENPNMEYYCIYELRDSGSRADETEDCWGVVDYDEYPESGIPYLASETYVTVANQNRMLAGCDKPTKLETNADGIYAYQYSNSKEDVLALWRTDVNTNNAVKLSLGDTNVTFVDAYGNETEMASATGEYDILPDFNVCYIKGNFENVAVSKSDMAISRSLFYCESEGNLNFSISGMTNAAKAVINENAFISKTIGFAGGKADVEIDLPELSDEISSFYIKFKNSGGNICGMAQIYINRLENAKFDFTDDFSDFSYDMHLGTNNRIDNWWIEQSQSALDVSKYIRVSDVTDKNGKTLTDALTICPATDLGNDSVPSSKKIRGGRKRGCKAVAGDTVTIEFDIYADKGASFGMALRTEDEYNVEDNFSSVFFAIRPDSDTSVAETSRFSSSGVYHSHNQNPGIYPQNGNIYSGITFVPDEVNHVKAEYTLTDSAEDTKDNITLTVSNSAGENQTVTKQLKFRQSNGGATKLNDIIGVSFQKETADGYVYIDNFSMSSTVSEYYLIKDDFSAGAGLWLKQGMNGISEDKWLEVADLKDKDGNVLLSDALHIGEYINNDEVSWGRVARTWANPIEPGESFTIEFDVYADDNTRLSLGLVPHDRTDTMQPYCYVMHFWSEKALDGADKNKLYYGKNQKGDNVSKSSAYSGITFVRNEVNHIKIDFDWNSSIADKTKDTVTLTVSNSAGENQTATQEVSFRDTKATSLIPYKTEQIDGYLSGVKGINFYKARDSASKTSGNAWIDNMKVYRKNVTVPKAVISAENIKAGDNTVTVSFTKAMTEAGVSAVAVSENGSAMDITKTLNSDGTLLTLTAPNGFKAGKEYIVSVPKEVYDLSGISIESAVSKSFVPISEVSLIELTQNGTAVDIKNIDSTKEITVNATGATKAVGSNAIICIAGYDSGNHLTDVRFTRVTVTDKTNVFKTSISDAETYKVFFWDFSSFEPFCASLM